MAEIFCRLNDDLKLEVLSFFSEYIIDTEITKGNYYSEEIYSIYNIVDENLCYGVNKEYGYYDHGYCKHSNHIDFEFSIDIEDHYQNRNGFYIFANTIDYHQPLTEIIPMRSVKSYIFYIEYIQKSYYHSNMWRITSGEGVECGTIFVNDDNLIDIIDQLELKSEFKDDILEKYKK